MNKIKEARKLCKITQTEFAKRLNIEQSNYCNIENGKFLVNTIQELKKKASSILVTELDTLITLKQRELSDIKKLRESLIMTITDFIGVPEQLGLDEN